MVLLEGVFSEMLWRKRIEKNELSSLGRVLVATNNLILEGKKILSWDNIMYI